MDRVGAPLVRITVIRSCFSLVLHEPLQVVLSCLPHREILLMPPHISTALLTEIRIHLMHAIPRAAPLPMAPIRTSSTLKSISRTMMHLQACEPNRLTSISPPPTYGSLARLVGGG